MNRVRPLHGSSEPEPALLSVAEVLKALRVSRSTFDTWRALGTAPTTIKLANRQLRIPRNALDTWLSGLVESGLDSTSRRFGHLLTLAEVLEELRVSRSTFDTWRALGTAPTTIKLPNGQLRIPRDDFDIWLYSYVERTA